MVIDCGQFGNIPDSFPLTGITQSVNKNPEQSAYILYIYILITYVY